MSVKTLIAMLAVAASLRPRHGSSRAGEASHAGSNTQAQQERHAAVNGVNYYYAVYGTGEPLLLLTVAGQIEMFGPNLTSSRRAAR